MDKRLKCTVCGYIQQDEGFLKCPVCGVGTEKFITLPEQGTVFHTAPVSEKKLVRIENVIHPEWQRHEIHAGRLVAQILSIDVSGYEKNISFEKESILIILDGSCEIECENGFDKNSFWGNDEKEESNREFRGAIEPETHREEEVEPERAFDKEKHESDGESSGNIEFVDSENNFIKSDSSDKPMENEMLETKKALLNKGLVIIVPRKTIFDIRNIGENRLIILHVSQE